VKCPKCGFVSYPGLSHCKKCGHKFSAAGRRSSSASSPLVSLFAEPTQSAAPSPPDPSPSEPPEPEEGNAAPPPEILFPAPSPKPAEEEEIPAVESSPAEPPKVWQEEVSQRVENFRKKRARLRGETDESENLDLKFDSTSGGEPPPETASPLLEEEDSEAGLDFALDRASEGGRPVISLETVSLGEKPVQSRHQDGYELEEAEGELPSDSAGAVEIVLDSSQTEETEASFPHPPNLVLAPLGRRFLAGLVDAAVLLSSLGLFALVFWLTGGRAAPNVLNICAFLLVVISLVMGYFASFVAITYATPGLLYMGLEVRNFQGQPPTTQESLWRAFGYLVSVSALMLGIIWATFDSEGLTWHDHMSGTFVTISSI
jgi:uncharacterized RDD family membrane protein YckC